MVGLVESSRCGWRARRLRLGLICAPAARAQSHEIDELKGKIFDARMAQQTFVNGLKFCDELNGKSFYFQLAQSHSDSGRIFSLAGKSGEGAGLQSAKAAAWSIGGRQGALGRGQESRRRKTKQSANWCAAFPSSKSSCKTAEECGRRRMLTPVRMPALSRTPRGRSRLCGRENCGSTLRIIICVQGSCRRIRCARIGLDRRPGNLQIALRRPRDDVQRTVCRILLRSFRATTFLGLNLPR